MTIKVAVIGASFAKAAYLPALTTIPDVELVAISSARLSSAQETAQTFGIPYVYDQWQTMLDKHAVDLVCVVTPTVHHAPMTLAALDAGANVICEKPFAMNADEAYQMYEKAESLERINVIGHELRFNPNRRKIKCLIEDGYIGKVRHINVWNIMGGGAPNNRVANSWWSKEDMGGGILGANGSHQLDLLRFWLGDIGALSGQLSVIVRDCIGKDTGEPWTATAEDQVNWMAEMKSGALASYFLSSAARHSLGNHVRIFGSEGTIMLSNDDEKLMVARAGEEFQDMSELDSNANLPGIGKGIWNVSFVALIQEVTAAIREKRRPNEGAAFADGFKCQQAMDAVRQSSAERRWVTLPSSC